MKSIPKAILSVMALLLSSAGTATAAPVAWLVLEALRAGEADVLVRVAGYPTDSLIQLDFTLTMPGNTETPTVTAPQLLRVANTDFLQSFFENDNFFATWTVAGIDYESGTTFEVPEGNRHLPVDIKVLLFPLAPIPAQQAVDPPVPFGGDLLRLTVAGFEGHPFDQGLDITVTDTTLTAVPLPAAAWLLAPALGLLGMARRRLRDPAPLPGRARTVS